MVTRISNESVSTVAQNIRTYDYYNISVTIPPGSNTYTQTLRNNLLFPLFSSNEVLITNISVFINPNSIYNLPVMETVIVNGSPVAMIPGYYTSTLIATLLNLTISPINNKSSANVSLDFTNAPNLLNITGFGSITVTVGQVGIKTFDVTNGFDVVSITSNLMQLADTSGIRYLDKVRLLDGSGSPLQNVIANVNIPVIQNSTNSITWSLFKKDGVTPFIFQNNVDIFLQMSVYKRNIDGK